MTGLHNYFRRSAFFFSFFGLTILTGCHNCGGCGEGAGLLTATAIGAVAAPVVLPGVLVIHALARGPTPVLSESAAGVERVALFDTDLHAPHAMWLESDTILLTGGDERGGFEARIMSLDGTPAIKVAGNLYGQPLGITNAGIITATETAESTIQFFNPQTLSLTSEQKLDCLARDLSADGRRLQCRTPASIHGLDLILIDTENWHKTARIHWDFGFGNPHIDSATAFAFDNNDDFLVGGSTGKLTRYYSSIESKPLSSPFKPGRIWLLKAIPDSALIAAAVDQSPSNGVVVVLDPEKGTRQLEVPISGSVSNIRFSVSENGRVLAVQEEHQVEVYNLQTRFRTALITIGEEYRIASATLDKSGESLVVTDAGKVSVFRLPAPTADKLGAGGSTVARH